MPWKFLRRRFRIRSAILLSATLCGLLGLFAAAQAGRQSPPQFDLLIVGGHIVDGSGNPWFEGSVAIQNGRIAAIGRLGTPATRRVINASGLVVAPGFIDLHSHSDFTLLVDGNAQSKIRQGVTTEILGESASAGPVLGPAAAELDRHLKQMGLERDWTTLGEYFARVRRQGISVNIASYVGSGQVRMDVMGNVNRPPTPEEMGRREELVEQAMKDGALGLASGLIYPPNSYDTTDELVALAKVAARYGGIYTTHIRNEDGRSLEAIREAIGIGQRAALPVHILHLKIAGQPNWGRMKDQIELIDAARARGIEVTADQYPYTASQTGLEMVLPAKFLEGSREEIVARLKDLKSREEIRREIRLSAQAGENQVRETSGWHGVMVASVQKPENKKYEGKRMDEVAQRMGKDLVDALSDLLVSEGGRAGAIYFTMSEPDVRLAMEQPWVGIGSDGSAVNPEMSFVGRPHPRFYGTFPRVLGRYVREEKVLTLPEAVRKMTSLAAQITGLEDRGLLRPGMAADITIFDPKSVDDRATFEDPMQYPVGIPYVIVNGVVVIDNGRHTGARPGRVLLGRGRAD